MPRTTPQVYPLSHWADVFCRRIKIEMPWRYVESKQCDDLRADVTPKEARQYADAVVCAAPELCDCRVSALGEFFGLWCVWKDAVYRAVYWHRRAVAAAAGTKIDSTGTKIESTFTFHADLIRVFRISPIGWAEGDTKISAEARNWFGRFAEKLCSGEPANDVQPTRETLNETAKFFAEPRDFKRVVDRIAVVTKAAQDVATNIMDRAEQCLPKPRGVTVRAFRSGGRWPWRFEFGQNVLQLADGQGKALCEILALARAAGAGIVNPKQPPNYRRGLLERVNEKAPGLLELRGRGWLVHTTSENIDLSAVEKTSPELWSKLRS